uniref:Uncharacterized protein n=1 Tax=Arundo donax TaxID=35708 RepID=A0A0A9FEL5_ARUDO
MPEPEEGDDELRSAAAGCPSIGGSEQEAAQA